MWGCVGEGVDGEGHRNRLPQGYRPENSRLTKIIFLEKFETAMRPSIKSRFSVMGFSINDSILGLCGFLFNNAQHYTKL